MICLRSRSRPCLPLAKSTRRSRGGSLAEGMRAFVATLRPGPHHTGVLAMISPGHRRVSGSKWVDYLDMTGHRIHYKHSVPSHTAPEKRSWRPATASTRARRRSWRGSSPETGTPMRCHQPGVACGGARRRHQRQPGQQDPIPAEDPQEEGGHRRGGRRFEGEGQDQVRRGPRAKRSGQKRSRLSPHDREGDTGPSKSAFVGELLGRSPRPTWRRSTGPGRRRATRGRSALRSSSRSSGSEA